MSVNIEVCLATFVTAGTHHDAIAAVVLALAVILVAARLGGDLAVRAGQPAVLGELVAGVVLGNLGHLGFRALDYLKSDPSVDVLSRLGVVLLLFEVGLESSIPRMLSLGLSSLLVATLGVVTPFALGWGLGAWLLPAAGVWTHVFLGATLTATSVGITARVFQDLRRTGSPEAQVIVGAAVIDDVFGLIILAVVTGLVASAGSAASLSSGAVMLIVCKAAAFLVGALVIGTRAAPRLFALAARLRSSGVLLAGGLSFCFLLCWLADAVGLAPIVGAFAAGLILEEFHYTGFLDRGEHRLDELVRPIGSFLVPVFFVLMGMRTDLRSFAEPGVLGLAAGLTFVAALGKQASSLGVLRGVADRLTVGLGMIPRGEVGLIFANVGAALAVNGRPVLTPSTYSAIVIMVITTTMMTPPLLKWSLGRASRVEQEICIGVRC